MSKFYGGHKSIVFKQIQLSKAETEKFYSDSNGYQYHDIINLAAYRRLGRKVSLEEKYTLFEIPFKEAIAKDDDAIFFFIGKGDWLLKFKIIWRLIREKDVLSFKFKNGTFEIFFKLDN